MLLRAGIVAMSVAIALAVAAVAVTVSVGDEPGRAIAAEPAAQAVKEPAVRPDPPVKSRVQYAESPPGLEAPRPEPEPVPRNVEPGTEPKPQPGLRPGRLPRSRPAPKPESPQPRATPRPEAKAQPEPEPRARPGVLQAEPKPEPRPASVPERERGLRPAARADAPGGAAGERRAVAAPRRFELPPGVVMTLTIRALGLRDVPVRSSDSQQALDNGVIHAPDTSLPWDEGAQRNVYLAGHRLGWPGTGSHRIFYDLHRLGRGDRVVLEDSRGHSFEYRVTGSFLVGPHDPWVKEVVPGHDMVTLQTCTPIPTFEKRLIVRANRV
jgi:sortase A